MKTGLRAFVFTTLFLLTFKSASAQCTISDIFIQNIIPMGGTTTSCTVKFDASFNLENNNGNKYIFIHAWLQSDYPNYFECVDGQSTLHGAIHSPVAGDLENEFMTIGIDNSGANPVIITTYPPDNSVPMTSVDGITRVVAPDGSADFVLYGIQVTLPRACGIPSIIIADLWSSQAAAAQVAHCVNCGIRYGSSYINLTGLANCATLTYSALLTNLTPTPLDGYYKVYADINGDAYFSPGTDTLIQDSTDFHIAASGTTTITGPIPPANMNQDLFIVATLTTPPADGAMRVVRIPSTICAPLPVTFQSFRATRINSNDVAIQWETATEVNNAGFAVYRNTGTGWEFVTYIPSQAMGGNSSSTLTYSFMDHNSFKGMTQYRIKQIDIDGKAKFSDIRTVRGLGQKTGIIVYPNPAPNGNVTVVFEDNDGIRDISLADNLGRTVKEWKGITGNTLQVDGLKPGMYTIRILVRGTRAQSVEKIMVTY
jgi:hypothetical protein